MYVGRGPGPKFPTRYLLYIEFPISAYPNFSIRQLPSASVGIHLLIYRWAQTSMPSARDGAAELTDGEIDVRSAANTDIRRYPDPQSVGRSRASSDILSEFSAFLYKNQNIPSLRIFRPVKGRLVSNSGAAYRFLPPDVQ